MKVRAALGTLLCVVLASITLTLPSAAVAADRTYAPLNRQGPKLSVPKHRLRSALECHGNPSRGPRAVLLSPATSVNPDQNYAWNWEKLFTRQGRYWCAVWMPHNTFGDIQVAAEYHVHAIRAMYRRTGRKVAILGHSQGGMNPRWALRFWPGTRTKVSELIGMAPSHHGTNVMAQCVEGLTRCVPAVWQQGSKSNFMKALNSRAETFAGIDYTNIYTRLDEVVRPPATASGLTTGRGRIANIAVQQLCPLDPYEHVLMGTVSPAVHALVMDALRHRGPAVLSRVDRRACNRLYMPGVDPADLRTNLIPLLALPSLLSTSVPNVTFSGAPMLAREPRVLCYAFKAGCR